MTVAASRRVALRALARVRRDDAFSGPVLASELAGTSLPAQEVALATRLTYGVLSAQGVLDDVLDRHLTGKIEPRVRDALRIAAFEALFGRAPGYAVVDQAVEMARAARPQAAGLANAVMRRVVEEASTFPWGDPLLDGEALARISAHPRWIVDLVLADLGEDAGRAMLECGLEPAPTYVRLDPFAAGRESALDSLEKAGPLPSLPDPDCFKLASPAAAFRDAEGSRSWFAMDAGAQMAPTALDPQGGERILDVGAGRGNKTVCLQALATRTGSPADILAIDIHPGKVATLARRLAASGVPGVRTEMADALHLAETLGHQGFDGVLLDAPCTGLGTLRRYPEKRWRLDPDAPARMAPLQRALLESAARVVRPGGRVVYSTCSVARAENEDVVSAFLGTPGGAGFGLEDLRPVIPPEWSAFRDDMGCFRSWPTSDGPDGHFVAVLRRTRG